MIKIALIGDIGLFGINSVMENPELNNQFRTIKEYLSTFDYVVGNLETPFIDETCHPRRGKSAHIGSSPKNIELLKYLNITHVNVANNHMYDYGRRGLDITLNLLDKYNIGYFGVDGKQLFINDGDTHIALSGFCCYSTNALGYQRKLTGKGVHVLDPLVIEKVIQENHRNGFYNIVSMHMGEEHVHYPNFEHMVMAKKLSDNNCPYFLYGHHPHMIQGMEKYKNSYYAYSLGNFCFDDVYTKKSKDPLIKQRAENNEGLILSLEFSRIKLEKVEVIPITREGSSISLFDDGVRKRFNEYCEFLNMEEKSYITTRRMKLETYYTSRKHQRDLQWYVKRMNLNSVFQIVNGKRNNKLFNRTVGDYNRKKYD